VICVTHAPQVAALGHHHLRVHKDSDQDTQIDVLAEASRVEELARMLAGADITDKSRDYARTLLREADSAAVH
jgi:DNA repair protein RecN (Recombination protein N)